MPHQLHRVAGFADGSASPPKGSPTAGGLHNYSLTGMIPGYIDFLEVQHAQAHSEPSADGSNCTSPLYHGGANWPLQEELLPCQPALEVTCQIDPQSQGGPPAFMPSSLQWLFRWYCKRGQKLGRPSDPAASTTGAPKVPAGHGHLAATVDGARVATPGVPLLEATLDPVMNCLEVIEMLEDFDILPRRMSRTDVYTLFKAAHAVGKVPYKEDLHGPIRPPEVRFPQFCDLLIRIALAAGSRPSIEPTVPIRLSSSQPSSSCWSSRVPSPDSRASVGLGSPNCNSRLQEPGLMSSSAGLSKLVPSIPLLPNGGERGLPTLATHIQEGRPVSPPNGLPCGRNQLQAMLAQEQLRLGYACVAVKTLLDELDVTHPTLLPLRQKLDMLTRTKRERVASKRGKQWMHVLGANHSAVSAALAAQLPGLRGWSVVSPTRAPEPLHQVLHLLGSKAQARPHWRTLQAEGLNLGEMPLGERWRCRMLIRNASHHTMGIHVDTSEVPWLRATFNEHTLAPGLPRAIHLQTHCLEPGAYTGQLKIYTMLKQSNEQCLDIIPAYVYVQAILNRTDSE